MKISGNAIKVGMIINHENRLMRALKTQHTQPGKGGAYLQVELKDIVTGTKMNVRFRSAENVERVTLEQKEYQYLFSSDGMITFMDLENYEQITVNSDLIGEEQLPFLVDGMMVLIESHEGAPLSVQLPNHVTVTIRDAEPVVKGQTVSSSFKPAILENGVRILVPPYVASGDKIVVSTSDITFVERAK